MSGPFLGVASKSIGFNSRRPVQIGLLVDLLLLQACQHIVDCLQALAAVAEHDRHEIILIHVAISVSVKKLKEDSKDLEVFLLSIGSHGLSFIGGRLLQYAVLSGQLVIGLAVLVRLPRLLLNLLFDLFSQLLDMLLLRERRPRKRLLGLLSQVLLLLLVLVLFLVMHFNVTLA